MTKTMAQHDKEIQEMEERFGGRWQELCLDPINVASAQALDLLWQDIILSRDPNYGDWEYPGQAYRHLLAEYRDIKAMNGRLADRLKYLAQQIEDFADSEVMCPFCRAVGDTSHHKSCLVTESRAAATHLSQAGKRPLDAQGESQ